MMLYMLNKAFLGLVLMILSVEANVAENTLKQIHVLFRHGDRAPIHTYAADPNSSPKWWPNGYAQLTKKGISQQHALGVWLRGRYGPPLGLSPHWAPEEVKVTATDVDRTINSAQANLQGLYSPVAEDRRHIPSLDWSPVPVRTVPFEFDQLLTVDKFCPRIKTEQERVLSTPKLQDILRLCQPLMDVCNQYLGTNVSTIVDLAQIYDYLFIHMSNNIPLPAWAPPHLTDLKWVEDLSFDLLGYTPLLKRLTGGPLVGKMLADMKRFSSHNATTANTTTNDHLETEHEPASPAEETSSPDTLPLLYMYSAHDTTVAVHLQTMGLYNDIMPPYAACVVHELHRLSTGWAVKTVYRNNTAEGTFVTLRVPGCDEMCPLEKLSLLMAPVIPTDYEKECHVDKPCTRSARDEALLWALTAACVLGAAAIIGMLVQRCRSPRYQKLPNLNDF